LTHVKQFRKLPIAALAAIVIAFAGVSLAATATAATADSTAAVSLSPQTAKKLNAKAKRLAAAKAKKSCRKKNGRAKRVCIRVRTKRFKKQIFRQLVRQLPGKPAPKITAKATFRAAGSVGDAYVTGAAENDLLILVNADDRIVATGKADSYGSKIFYEKKPASGYTVRLKKNGKVFGTKAFSILKPGANPPQSFYQKTSLQPGLNFVKMRDGIELAMTVKIPSGPKPAGGWPVLIEHSGYGTAAPHDLLTAVLAEQGGADPDPLAPDTSTAVGALIGPQMKFATISVQMRGSGCSGGAYGLFDLPTTYDGYDMVEYAANQSWSSGKVGMVGISYSGISQLFAGGTRPPHLAAITPMSPTTDLYAGTGYPGGMFNNGFAQGWITDRVADAQPAPDGGQQWARVMSTTGDPKVAEPLRSQQKQHCLDNQKLRLQTRDVFQMIQDNPFRTPNIFGPRSPGDWLAKVKAPVFFVGSFQDEQTGGQFAEALSGLKNNPNVWMVLQNGVHVDSLSPSLITSWGDFLNLFVADRIPQMPGLLVGMGPMLYTALADAPSVPIQESAYAGYPKTDAGLAQARADFRQDNPRLRLLMDNGAGVTDPDTHAVIPGGIGAAWDLGFSDYPVPSTTATTWYLGAGGALSPTKDGAASDVTYTADPAARQAQTLPGNDEGAAWKAQPPYQWDPVAAGKGLGFTSAALAADTMIAGPSSVDLELKSSALDTDLQVAISEVRPDGHETYVQSGWLRASHRKLDPKKSTALDPVPTHLEKDAANLPAGQFTTVRVPVYPVAHMFRAGSKIRLTITAPGGDRPRWRFQTIEDGATDNTIQLGGVKPSKLVLPVIPGITAAKPLPGPTDLRGEPDRMYAAASNGG